MYCVCVFFSPVTMLIVSVVPLHFSRKRSRSVKRGDLVDDLPRRQLPKRCPVLASITKLRTTRPRTFPFRVEVVSQEKNARNQSAYLLQAEKKSSFRRKRTPSNTSERRGEKNTPKTEERRPVKSGARTAGLAPILTQLLEDEGVLGGYKFDGGLNCRIILPRKNVNCSTFLRIGSVRFFEGSPKRETEPFWGADQQWTCAGRVLDQPLWPCGLRERGRLCLHCAS